MPHKSDYYDLSKSEALRNILNAIPGGVAIYKVSDIFETVYFSDGVPQLSGYTVEEYREMMKSDAIKLTHPEDTAMVEKKLRQAIRDNAVAEFEFCKQHRDGHAVWVHIQAKQIGEEDGCPLLHCVFYDVSKLKETQLELDHLINSIPGGIACYIVENGHFIPTLYSDGILSLSGHTRREYDKIIGENALNLIYEPDMERILPAIQEALKKGTLLDISYRIYHKDGHLVWIHLNGRRIGPLSDSIQFYAVLTGMSAEAQLFQSIANETADGIYVIDRETYELLYVNESKKLFQKSGDCVGKKCYSIFHDIDKPCDFCTLKDRAPDGKPHDMRIEGSDRYYTTRFRETDWNGIPAYLKYVEDVTEEVKMKKEKERLERYFETLVSNLPGGVAVIRHQKDGRMVPEYLSKGFCNMTGMSEAEAWKIYQKDAMSGVHPDDYAAIKEALASFITGERKHAEMEYRLKKGDGTYLWIKNSLSRIQSDDGEYRVYANFLDMTEQRERQKRLRRQYQNLIFQHYRVTDPNVLIVGHCNVSKNQILDIIDRTDLDMVKGFGTERSSFFNSIAGLVVEQEERREFLKVFLNDGVLAAFSRGETEISMTCFVKLPREKVGRYAEIHVNLVEAPDTGDITGIMTVTDVTARIVSEQILHKLSSSSYDFIADVDLFRDSSLIINGRPDPGDIPVMLSGHSRRVQYMLDKQLIPRDRKRAAELMDPNYMMKRLEKEGAYSFAYSAVSEQGEIQTKKLNVFAVDLRIGRVCLARADITDSVREQQGLFNVVANTFELLAFIQTESRQITIYTKQTVQENLPPYVMDNYDISFMHFVKDFVSKNGQEEVEQQFRLNTVLARLKENPSGYDFVLPYRIGNELCYKQINVLWGDNDHKTICMVRMDVTDSLMEERRSKEALEKALEAAEEANRAKSDFLSSMSHDIRTPMNAIIGMTALATAYLDDRRKVEECLQKTSVASKHLLSLVNDILDMSKIENSKITLHHRRISVSEMLEQLASIMMPQAKTAGLQFEMLQRGIRHPHFYGDSLRINQILINLLSNAVKFTPEGGSVEFTVEEIPPHGKDTYSRYRFTVKDTGVGMSEEFQERIFDSFTRSKSAENIEGTGLGLSISKGLLDLMGGSIRVESKKHCGTTFEVELECEIAQEETAQRAGQESEDSLARNRKELSGRHFLVVEDNAINAEILCELLQMHGAESAVRTDGEQAVHEFINMPSGTYDGILMDIQMPKMNGYEATRIIRRMEREDAGEIPIIAMTANAFAEDIQAAKEAGMSAHVAKPIDIQILLQTLGELLERKG